MSAPRHQPSDEPVYRESAPVVRVSALRGGHCRLRLGAPSIAASIRPGQFVNVGPPGDSTLLRRPFGVYQTLDRTDIELLFKVVGKGTAALAEVSPGDELDIIGPLGNGFDLSEDFAETAVLVAGGFGVAPLYALAQALREKGSQTYLFVGTEEDVPVETSDSSMQLSFVDPDVKITLTDFEELGAVARVASMRHRPGFFHGLASELLERFLHHAGSGCNARVYACGPWAMLKRTAGIAAEYNLTCEVLLEERMGCGIGACMSCAVRLKGENGEPVYARACVEGPVFDAAIVDWDAK